MDKIIRHTLFYPHKPEMVWEYLVTPELIAQWLMPNDFLPIVWYNFQFRTSPLPNVDFDGIIYCTVLEVVPLKKLSYSWKGGPGNGTISMDSIVYWTLIEKDNGTELIIEHSDFKVLDKPAIFDLMEQGWLKNIKKIVELINTAKHVSTNL